MKLVKEGIKYKKWNKWSQWKRKKHRNWMKKEENNEGYDTKDINWAIYRIKKII